MALYKRGSELKDLVVAVGCGLIAVVIGVSGVIMMTRRLVEDDSLPIPLELTRTKTQTNGM